MLQCGIVHTDLKTENVLVYHRPDPFTGIENDEVGLMCCCVLLCCSVLQFVAVLG